MNEKFREIINIAILLKHWYVTPHWKVPEQILNDPRYPRHGKNTSQDLWSKIPDELIAEQSIAEPRSGDDETDLSMMDDAP